MLPLKTKSYFDDNDDEPLLPKSADNVAHHLWEDEHLTNAPALKVKAKRTKCRIFFRHLARIALLSAVIYLGWSSFGPAVCGRFNRIRFRNEKDIPIPPQIKLGQCAEFGPNNPSATFRMPIDQAEKAVLYAEGGLAKGVIITKQSNDSSSTSRDAKVTVTPIYDDPAFLKYSKVCEVTEQWDYDDGDLSRGVGIFTVPWSAERFGHFEMTIELPASPEVPLQAGSLWFNTPGMRNEIGYLPNTHFHILRTNSDYRESINAGFVSSNFINLETLHKPISGRYRTDSFMYMKATKAPVDVEVHLHDSQDRESSPGERWDRDAVTSSVKSVGGSLNINAFLTSANTTHGVFEVEAHTSLSNILLNFPEAPVNSTLSIRADTSLGTATVLTHPTYEGTFRLEAPWIWRRRYLRDGGAVRDPAGQGRHRILWQYDATALYEDGALLWVKDGDREKKIPGPGSIWVASSAGGAELGY